MSEMSNKDATGEPVEYYLSMTFLRGGLLDGYVCPNCGQRVGSLQVHNCRPRTWPNTPTPWPNVPSIPWIDPNTYPVVPVTPPYPTNGYFCGVCGVFVPDGISHKCPGAKPQPRPQLPGTRQPFTCPKCNGERKVNGKRCTPCKGTGIVWG